MDEKIFIKKSPIRNRDIEFVYNGLFVFLPNKALEEKTIQEIEDLKKLFKGITYDQYVILLMNLTGEKTLERAVMKLYELRQNPDLVTTVPTNLQDLVDDMEKAPSQDEGVQASVKERVEDSIETLKKIQAEREKGQNEETIDFDPKVVPATSEVFINTIQEDKQIDLQAEENKDLKELFETVQQNPKDFHDEAMKRVMTQLGSDPKNALTAEELVNDFIIKTLNVNLQERFLTIDESPVETLKVLSDPDNVRKFIPDKKQATAFAQIMRGSLDRKMTASIEANAILSSSLGVDLSRVYVPTLARKTEVTTTESQTSVATLNVNSLITEVAQINETTKKIVKEVRAENPGVWEELEKAQRIRIEEQAREIAKKLQSRTKAFDWMRSKGGKRQLPKEGHYSRSYFYTSLSQSQLPDLKRFNLHSVTALPTTMVGVPQGSFLPLSLLNIAAEKSLTKIPAVAKLSSTVAGFGTKVVAKAVAKKGAAAVAANAIPVIGQAISVVTTASAIKDLAVGAFTWIRKNWKEFLGLSSIGLLSVGLSAGSPILIGAGVGGVVIAGSSVIIGGIGTFLSLLAAIVLEIGIAFGLVILSIPIIVAFILLIINNSAYVYPPITSSRSEAPIVSPWVRVEKTAQPPGPFDNDIELTINYRIEISALQSDLSNIVLVYDCFVYAETPEGCPAPTNVNAGPLSNQQSYPSIEEALNAVPATITAADPFIITYTVVYTAGRYNDSSVTDTITVEATAEGSRTQASGSETIIIGEPPLDCFVITFDDAQHSNLQTELSNLRVAINTIISQHPVYAQKVCSAWQTIYFDYYDGAPAGVFGFWHGNGHISLSSQGLANTGNAKYTTGHELGHALHDGLPNYFSEYQNYPGTLAELPMCTYAATTNPYEGFAEAMGLYVGDNYVTSCHSGRSGFASLYPANYQFAKDIVMEE